jgi:hypothetical protein
MCIENVVCSIPKTRWPIAFGFGLVHGFGFSFALQSTLQFAGDHVLTSLLAFNVGIELGQLAFIAVALPALALLLHKAPVSERVVVAIISALVAHTAWHWLAERWETLQKAEWPEVDVQSAALWFVLALALGVLARALLSTKSTTTRWRRSHE